MGVIRAKKMNDCGVLRAHQMPEMELIFVEEPDPECPFGARGVGEIGLVPTAPAIAGALYRYDGVVRTTIANARFARGASDYEAECEPHHELVSECATACGGSIDDLSH